MWKPTCALFRWELRGHRCRHPASVVFRADWHPAECLLLSGLERFKFEDATAGEDGGNTTGGFGDS